MAIPELGWTAIIAFGEWWQRWSAGLISCRMDPHVHRLGLLAVQCRPRGLCRMRAATCLEDSAPLRLGFRSQPGSARPVAPGCLCAFPSPGSAARSGRYARSAGTVAGGPAGLPRLAGENRRTRETGHRRRWCAAPTWRAGGWSRPGPPTWSHAQPRISETLAERCSARRSSQRCRLLPANGFANGVGCGQPLGLHQPAVLLPVSGLYPVHGQTSVAQVSQASPEFAGAAAVDEAEQEDGLSGHAALPAPDKLACRFLGSRTGAAWPWPPLRQFETDGPEA